MLFLSDVLQIKNKQLYIEVGFCVICFSIHLLFFEKYVTSLAAGLCILCQTLFFKNKCMV